jgi:polyisoprenoid-binding protein YceI
MPLMIFLLIFLHVFDTGQGNLLVTKTVQTTLFSEAPLENIEARSLTGVSILNTATNEVQFTIPIRSFKFSKTLMQEHFNENYMESDKYPNARFKGKLTGDFNPEKDGDYPVTATGELEVHGVKRLRTIKGTMKVRDNKISLGSAFDVKCQDHNIKIPQIVFQKVAETIRVTVSSSYSAYNL